MNANNRAWAERMTRALDCLHTLNDFDPTLTIERVDVQSATPAIFVDRPPRGMAAIATLSRTERGWAGQVLVVNCFVSWIAFPLTHRSALHLSSDASLFCPPTSSKV